MLYTLLGSNEHNACGSSHTIGSSAGGILKDTDGLDFIGTEIWEGTDYSIHYYQHLSVSGTDSTDIHTCPVRAWLTAPLLGHQTWEFTGEKGGKIGGRSFLQFSVVNLCDSTCHCSPLLKSITYYHGLVEELVVIVKHYIQELTFLRNKKFALITQ